MKKNVGTNDRIIRIILAVGIGYFAFSTEFQIGWTQSMLFIISVIMLLTSILGSCPLYSLFRVDTCKFN